MFQDKVAIVTGSSMGIGRAIAYSLAESGAKIVLTGRNAEKLAAAAEEMQGAGHEVLAVQGDVSKWADNQRLIDTTIQEFGRLDILVNNAGVATRGSVEDLSPEVFQQVMDVNVLGTIFPSKLALPHLKKTKGHIICISSIASLSGIPFNSVYCSSKKALTAFTESLRLEVKQDGIHVGILYVGFTENDPNKIIMDSDGKKIYLEERKGIKKQSPQQVAQSVLGMIRKRTKSKTLTVSGKFLQFVTRFIPPLMPFIFSKKIEEIRANSSGKARYVKEKVRE